VEITSRVARWKNNGNTVTAYAIYVYIYIYIEREREKERAKCDRISLFGRSRDADDHESSSTSDPPLHAVFSPRRSHNNAFVRRSIGDTSIFTREQAISRYRHDFPSRYSDCGVVVVVIADVLSPDESIEEFFPSDVPTTSLSRLMHRACLTRAEICRIRVFSGIRSLASTKLARCPRSVRDLSHASTLAKRESR